MDRVTAFMLLIDYNTRFKKQSVVDSAYFEVLRSSQELLSLSPGWFSHRVISDKVHLLLLMLFYFQPDRFVQLFRLIPILILLLYL